MYKKLEALDAANANHRIAPLAAYLHLAPLRLVPIFYIEVAALAAHWPVVWTRRGDGGHDLVAVVGLAATPPLVQRLAAKPLDAVPLLLRAYPLTLSAPSASGDAAVLIDAAPAGGKGQPVFERGELGEAAQRRTDILWLLGPERPRAETWTADLAAANAFEPWRLRLSFDDRDMDNEELLVVSAEFLSSDRYVALAGKHGPDFVSAIEHHVLSRLRVQDQADDLSRNRRLQRRSA